VHFWYANKQVSGNFMTTLNTSIILTTVIFLFVSCNEHNKSNKQLNAPTITQMDDYELTPETAHPRAKQIMTEDFFWSPIEESGPFGNDDGSDAFYGFRDWRQSNKTVSPVIYLEELIERWGYDRFDFNEMNEENLNEYVSSSSIGARTLIGQDNAIIAIGFGQFVLEGKIDEDIKVLTKTALNRELLPSIINMWDDEYKKIRTEQLTKMLTTVDRMNE